VGWITGGLVTIAWFTVAIFGSFSHVWQKNDQNGQNEVKKKVKNGYSECSE
jgi:hypothetical protein